MTSNIIAPSHFRELAAKLMKESGGVVIGTGHHHLSAMKETSDLIEEAKPNYVFHEYHSYQKNINIQVILDRFSNLMTGVASKELIEAYHDVMELTRIASGYREKRISVDEMVRHKMMPLVSAAIVRAKNVFADVSDNHPCLDQEKHPPFPVRNNFIYDTVRNTIKDSDTFILIVGGGHLGTQHSFKDNETGKKRGLGVDILLNVPSIDISHLNIKRDHATSRLIKRTDGKRGNYTAYIHNEKLLNKTLVGRE